MASTGNLVSIKMIADRLLRNPLMKDLNYEFIVDNAIQVLRILDAPSLYVNRREVLNVSNYRALKPIDIIKVEGIARTDGGRGPVPLQTSEDISQEFFGSGSSAPSRSDNTYSLNSKYVSLNFEKGTIELIYKAIAVDEECYPLILDNETLLRCVESYIKWKWFDILNDMELVSDRKLDKAETDYCFNVAQADANIKLPSLDEMETLTNTIVQLIPSATEFSKRFEFLGNQEHLKIH
ncbi:hypothetical protein [Clostridium sp.]|jgi:hypothetical protein|uniref:hypothetical protein n=1 Tax=Clostridium sp. TaxID=1506 RepID=UPI003EE8B4B8